MTKRMFAFQQTRQARITGRLTKKVTELKQELHIAKDLIRILEQRAEAANEEADTYYQMARDLRIKMAEQNG